ncbi:hypothetical protein SUDANB6_00534 [Streptomyces sp. enrichment culture]|uniref:hypothetical protein n=1 Tax=Streptomyces sp. enrichment culture TaxID=1795815 RepID=UPI003F558476
MREAERVTGVPGRRRGPAGPGLGPWDCPRPPGGENGRAAPVVVHQQLGGGRQVSVGGRMVGTARSVAEVLAVMRRVGVHLEHEEVRTTPLIEWRGGGADAWQ